MAGEPIITEFVASNDTTLLDGNGSSSDWIEIFNAGNEAVDLDDYTLTDDASDPSKWEFPSFVLGAGEYLVVFASNDDAPDAAGNLHTNFKLSAGGEYLGLYDPDGGLLSEFVSGGGDYSPQITDVSYGREFNESTLTATPVGSTVSYLIPDGVTGPAVGEAWTQAGYPLGLNGESWQSGSTGIGYDLDNDFDASIATDVQSQLFGQGTSVYLRSTFAKTQGQTIDTLRLRAQYDDGFIAYLNGTEVLSVNGVVSSDVASGEVPLGNLFDDDKGVSLAEAIESDTYQAVASTSDLGLYAVAAGGLDGDLIIAPGVSFNFVNVGGGGGQAGSPSNDTWRSVSTNGIRTTGVSGSIPSVKIEDGVGTTANNMLTFDLEELRAAGGFAATSGYFSARAGLNDTAGANQGRTRVVAIISDANGSVLAGYVNGHRVEVNNVGGVWSFSGPFPASLQGVGNPRLSQFAFPVPGEASYLTLASTSDGSINSDHAVFSGASFEFNSIPLGNLFDDPASALLSDAVASDTPGSRGDIGDLGVEVVQDGEFQADIEIAPNLLFNLSNVGSSLSGDGVGPGNDTVFSGSDEPIRTRGVVFGSLDEITVEDGVGLRADELITYNLSELRAAGGLGNEGAFRFKARAAINDSSNSSASGHAIVLVSDDAGTVLGAWMNGQVAPVVNNGGIWSLDFTAGVPSELTIGGGAVDFDLPVPSSAAYLTLVGSGGASTSTNDEIVFSGARLVILPGQGAAAWDSAASVTRDDTEAVTFQEFDLSAFTGLIQEGQNVLAVHALNNASTDRDFLFSHELITGSIDYDNQSGRYFTTTTPGQPNDASPADLAPIVVSVTDSPLATNSDPILVQAELFQTVSPIAQVTMHYRVMYGPEVAVSMVDDGSVGGDVAGDGVYTAVIPASVSDPGEMVRWRVTVEDTANRLTKSPEFDDPFKSAEYHGTMIADDSFSTPLEVIHWFQSGGGRGSVYHDGEFYDNILIRTRGQSSNNSPKKNLKFDFNPDHRFLLDPSLERVDEINLNNTYYDQADVRATLSSEVFAAAGSPAPITYPVQTRRNGSFYSLAILVEQVDAEFLIRNGLDPNGTLYKSTGLNGFDPAVGLAGFEKKTRLFEGDEGLTELAAAVNPGLPQSQREQYLYDNVDVFSVINYLAATSVIHNVDHTSKNHYVYQDTEGTGEWSFLPWDLDLTFGKNGANTPDIESYEADVTDQSSNKFPNSHPFFGGSEYTRFNNPAIWNRLIDAVLDTPELREMYLRRLRTVMDTVLQSPDTAPEDRLLEARLAELLPLIQADWTLDDARWIEAPQTDKNRGTDWGEDLPLATHFQRIIDRFLDPRRVHLYETHSIDNLPTVQSTTLIQERGQARYLVPTDNSLGFGWTTTSFDDSGWTDATLGIGYETSGSNFAPLIETDVRPQDTPGGATSLFTRVPFGVDTIDTNAQLTLRVRYDDGFVAYLNGSEVARRNVSGTPVYNSSASNNPDGAAVVFEPIDISQHAGLLNQGSNNVLAIHSVNSSTNSSDQLIMVELVYGENDPVDVAGIPHEQADNPPIEIDPIDFDANPVSGNQDEEYLKLVNRNQTAVDISGWRLRGGVEQVMRPGTVIPARSTLYVVADAKAFRTRGTGPTGGQNLLVHGNYRGNLSNTSEVVELVSDDGTIIDTLTTPELDTPVQRFLRLTEINYNPPGSEDATEFIELTNISAGGVATTLDLVGVTITEGPSTPFVFAGGTTLAPGESLVVVKDQAAFSLAYPGVDPVKIAGEFSGGLNNTGEDILVEDADGNTLAEIDYRDRDLWTRTADGAGGTLELIDPSGTPRQQLGKPQSWRGSTTIGGTPAATNSQPLGVVINEVLTHTDTPLSDTIELHNVTGGLIDVGGWYLSDSDDNLQKFQIPLGTTIAANGYLILDETDFNPTPNTQGPNDFALDSTNGDQVWLTSASGEFADQVEFGPTLNAESLGRLPNGIGRLVPQSRRTLGSVNRAHRTGPLVITEVQYNPGTPNPEALAVDPSLSDNDLEFVEVHNATGSSVALDNWALDGEVLFAFDAGTSIAPGATLLVLPFNPADIDNTLRLQAFRTHYSIGPSVAVVGGFDGRLNNGYGRVDLTRPDPAPEASSGFVPITSDQVIYDDFSPWPTSADGLGASLQRVAPTAYGNSAASWFGDTPTPGDVGASPIGDFDGDGSVTPTDLQQHIDAVHGGSPLTAYDLDGVEGLTTADTSYLIEVIVDPIEGDYDWDGDVDQADRDTWAAAYGSTLALNADGSRDGVVDATDYTVWRDSQMPVTPAPVATAVLPVNAPAVTVSNDMPVRPDVPVVKEPSVPSDKPSRSSVRPPAREAVRSTAGHHASRLAFLLYDLNASEIHRVRDSDTLEDWLEDPELDYRETTDRAFEELSIERRPATASRL